MAKYTDEQIKETLQKLRDNGDANTFGYAVFGNLVSDTLDLINRQEAEIERLKQAYLEYEETSGLKWARADAIKKFAKKAKAKIHDSVYQYWNFGEGGYYLAEDVDDDIDNIVAEMVGESK